MKKKYKSVVDKQTHRIQVIYIDDECQISVLLLRKLETIYPREHQTHTYYFGLLPRDSTYTEPLFFAF